MDKAIATILVCAGLAAPAAADWLVMKDGARVETVGPWKIQGAVVLFTLPGGTLSSLRLSEVDLDASAEATYEAAEPPIEEPAEEEKTVREPVLVLTNKDVSRAREVPMAAEAETEDGDEPRAVTEGFRVLDLELRPRGDGVEVLGTLVNDGEERLEGLVVLVALYDSEGTRLAEASATLTTTALRPGAGAPFRAYFARVTAAGYRAELDVRWRQPRS